MKNEIFHMQVCTYVQTCYAQKTAQKGEKMVSILEYGKKRSSERQNMKLVKVMGSRLEKVKESKSAEKKL